MRESWRRIEGHEGYEVSNMGRVRNAATQKVLKPYGDTHGYLKVELDGVNCRVHILVARAFIPNPECKPVVNHKHSNRADNRASQLEWVTQSENIKHSWQFGGRAKRATARRQRITI